MSKDSLRVVQTSKERKKILRRRLLRAALNNPIYLVILVLLLGARFFFYENWLLKIPFFVGAAILAFYYIRWMKRLRRTEYLLAGFCPRCEYDLTGNISGVCPECGTACQISN